MDNSLLASDNQTSSETAIIDAMLARQNVLSGYLGVYNLDEEEQLRSTLSQLAVEAAEALAPFLNKTKPWKSGTPDLKEVDTEVIDVLHYVLTYFNIRKMTQTQIVALYFEKNTYNFERVNLKMRKSAL